MGRQVEVVDYDPQWPRVFEELSQPIADVLGPLALRIEHVGSTSVPGLAAKPIVDLDVVIASREDLAAVIERLRGLGYEHRGDLGIPGREAFTIPAGLPAHHLYVCAADNAELARHLAFRDHLRAHPDTVEAYANLKRTLATRFPDDRVAYTDAKTTFVEGVLAGAVS
ncbi:GrpB family protein [Sinosporangium siamense]|uniref:GrpB family protein n=1 Tax=Sinosporangium siamense TaxID=1367973 RepID=A0A919VGZ2_9ACTN|nr:GrpB family protein [Sinosporangium siamense]GII97594.1 hypothetical protein Ssi02_78250 [Sinosporangium siamense]